MKLFNKKEEKNKVGRPKLADTKTKKKSIISISIALVMIVALLLTGAFKLNIIKFSKIKGSINYRCEEIPERFRLSDSNPNGFDDINFYSAVANEIDRNDSGVCDTLTEENMKQITNLSADNIGMKNINGYHYLENLETFIIRNNDIEILEVIGMPNLKTLYYDGNLNIKNLKLKDLPLLENTFNAKLVNLENLEIENVPKLREPKINSQKNLKSIRFVNSPSLYYNIDYEESSIERVYVDNIDYFRLGDYYQENMYNNLKSFKAYNVNNLRGMSQLGGSSLDELDVKNCVLDESISLTTSGSKLEHFDIVSLGDMLGALIAFDVNQENIDLSHNTNLFLLFLNDGTLKSLDLSSNVNLVDFALVNSNLKTIDLSKQENLQRIHFQNNQINGDVYLQKNKTFDYDDLIKLNDKYEITFSIENDSIGKVENHLFTALKEGETIVRLSNENITGYTDFYFDNCMNFAFNNSCTEETESANALSYFFENKIKVYDVTSKEYSIDSDKKIIDVKNKEFNIENIKVTEGYTKDLSENVLTIKDGDILVDTYTLVNVKEEPKIETTKPATTTNKTTTQENKTTTTKKVTTKKTSSKTTVKNDTRKTTTNKHNLPEGNLIVYGNYIPDTMLEQIKGQDRNLTLINEDVSILINGKDVEEVKDINIDYRLKKYEEDKNMKNAFILEFTNKKELPKKFEITIKVTEEFKKVLGLKNIDIYDYSDNKLSMMEENIDVVGNKISFSTDKLDKYILMKEDIKEEKQETKKSKLNVCLIMILLLLLLIIGYILYKKSKEKEGA